MACPFCACLGIFTQGWGLVRHHRVSMGMEQADHTGTQQAVGMDGPGSAMPGLMLSLPHLMTPSVPSDLLN